MIDPTGRLQASLYKQTQDWPPRNVAGGVGGKSVDAHQPELTSQQEKLQTMARQIAAIKRDDPQARRKAFRIYLESALIQEFGSRVATDPSFASWVTRVQDTMEADATLKEEINRAGSALLEKNFPGKIE